MTEIRRNTTTKAIYQAFFQLLRKSSFDAISVNDICQESLISRTTFSSYFEDKYQLVSYVLEEERRYLGLIPGVEIQQNIESFLNRIQEEQDVYQHLLVSNGNRDLNRSIILYFLDSIKLLLSDRNPSYDNDILTTFYTGGFVFTIVRWIESGCIENPIELADVLCNHTRLENKL